MNKMKLVVGVLGSILIISVIAYYIFDDSLSFEANESNYSFIEDNTTYNLTGYNSTIFFSNASKIFTINFGQFEKYKTQNPVIYVNCNLLLEAINKPRFLDSTSALTLWAWKCAEIRDGIGLERLDERLKSIRVKLEIGNKTYGLGDKT